MNKLLLAVVAVFLVLCCIWQAAPALALDVFLDGRPVEFADQDPYIDDNGRTMIPLRGLFEQLSAGIEWDEATMAVTIFKDPHTLVFTVGEYSYLVDGVSFDMDTAAALTNNRVCLPIRAVMEALGARVVWEENTGTVSIWYEMNPPVLMPESQDNSLPPSQSDPALIDDGVAIKVTDVQELISAIEEANSGGRSRIILQSGDYALEEMIYITAPGITIESETGTRDDVNIHGPCFQIFGVAASDFTLKNLSVGNVETHAVQIHGELDADRTTLKNVHFYDTGEQMLKISYEDGNPAGSDYGVVEDCYFEYPSGVGPQYYIGGIDAHQAKGWIIRHNRFENIRSPEEDLAEHAIHFWSGSRDTLVEKNVIVNCDRGIGFGLGERPHYGGIIRNNMVYTSRDVGIGLESCSGAIVINNSLWTAGYENSVEIRFSSQDNNHIYNNLCNGNIVSRDDGKMDMESNCSSALITWFSNAEQGNLHLAAPIVDVIDRGTLMDAVTDDFDGRSRPQGDGPDIGAQEYR